MISKCNECKFSIAAGECPPCDNDFSGFVSKEGELKSESNALDVQVGGGHYKDYAIQPIEFCQKNRLNACETSIVKYICRHGNKNGIEDLKKAKHYIDLLIELEYSEELES